MDLKEFLLDVFPNKDEEKYTKLIDNLKSLGFESVSDLKYLDEEAVKELNSFNRIEIKRLTDYLAKYEFHTLEDALSEIFARTHRNRIKEIKIFLNEHEVYLRRDILVININKLRIKEFFSESELKKIEGFLEKNNREYYYEIMTEKEIHKSDLILALYEIFNGASMKRISEIEEILKGQDITAKKDLIYVDLDKFRKEKVLADIEISKMETFIEQNYKEQFHKIKETMELEKSIDLRHVLKEILLGTPTNRLEEIEEILNKEEIYSGKDVLIADLNNLHLKESLSSAEMLKFQEYLKKKNVIHYEKLMSDRELEKSKNLKYVLKQIFLDTPEERLAEIENILKMEQIYSGLDMKIVDSNDLRGKKSLSDIEILKIEEYIKKNNRERYDDIKAVKMAEDERKLTKLKLEDEIQLYTLKETEKLKFMQLHAQEEQKMIEFKTEGEKLLRKEEREFLEAKAKVEMERENMRMLREKELREEKAKEEMEREKVKMQREKELREEKAKEEIEREKIKMQREKELREEKAKEDREKEKFEMQRERELREAKAKEEMEREKIASQRKKELREAKAKEEMEREKIKLKKEVIEKRCESLISEKKGLLDDVRDLEKECNRLKKVITEIGSQTGIVEYFKNSFVDKKKAQEEYDEKRNSLKSKIDRIAEIDKILKDTAEL